jgi:hypothetical protein
MAIQAINCPGYYEGSDGNTKRMKNGEERFFTPAIIQEVGDQISVRCTDCIEGMCVSGVGKLAPEGIEGTGDDGAKQRECFVLENGQA